MRFAKYINSLFIQNYQNTRSYKLLTIKAHCISGAVSIKRSTLLLRKWEALTYLHLKSKWGYVNMKIIRIILLHSTLIPIFFCHGHFICIHPGIICKIQPTKKFMMYCFLNFIPVIITSANYLFSRSLKRFPLEYQLGNQSRLRKEVEPLTFTCPYNASIWYLHLVHGCEPNIVTAF